ncbi:MAG: hypothetical protein CVV64_17510 [Candidatus Wallbacteria bacterium HGW-Wallbacteria-1]|jgi:tetratricopeptide (TPR) repeat protein|uniref:Protein unc-45 homolog B n=1 Tax=Candidatus Wallbacteria bacterium HGW-Wallbacteria-1 TaxID=2013854 RepID=A0A2N1PK78_9BACT|nr:MAG: hypothetical protein CVV64_17510 [Candidatus Wallbacteria bacterium HGW-Wallbacteria-1]
MSNLEQLLKNLRDGDASLKKLSIQTLAKQPFDRRIYDAMAAAASADSSQEVRYFARKALAFIEKKNGMERAEAPSASADSTGGKPDPVGQDAAVEAALRSSDPKKIMAGLQAVANGRMTSFVPMIQSILTPETHPVVVANAAKIIGTLAGGQGITFLSTLLEHPDPRVRANAVEGLGLTRSASAIPHIMRALKDSDNRVKANALSLLEKVGAVNVARILDQMLSSQAISLRDSAIWAASRLKGREIGEVLVKALNSESDSELQIKILQALGEREPNEVLRGLSEFGDSIVSRTVSGGHYDPAVLKAFEVMLKSIMGRGDELIRDYVSAILSRITSPSGQSDSLSVSLSDSVDAASAVVQPGGSTGASSSPVAERIIVSAAASSASASADSSVDMSDDDSERKAKAMASMLLVPMGTPQGGPGEVKTNEWERILETLGEPVNPESLSEEKRAEIADFLGTIEVWRNNGYNVEPLFRALGRRQDELEGIFDRYACLIQRCNKLATRFKRLDVSLFKDDVVDISLNLKNPTMVEELEIKVSGLENRVRESKQDYVARLERYKAGGFDVKNLEIAMIENLKTIKDEFDSFEKRTGDLLELKEHIKPFRCKAFTEKLQEIDTLFGEAGNIPRIKTEIEALSQEFEKMINRHREEVDRWEKYGLDTSQLKRAIAARDMDLIELQVGSLKESVRTIDEIERKFRMLDHEIFSDRLTELRKGIKNPAAIKGINFDLDELLKHQNEELNALKTLAEKWGQAGYDVSTLHACCSESLTWARKVFADFREANNLEEKLPEIAGSTMAISSAGSAGASPARQSEADSTAAADHPPHPHSDDQGDDDMPAIEWWNLDFSLLREYLGDDMPEGADQFDSSDSANEAGESETDSGEPGHQDDLRLQKAVEASEEMAEIYGSMSANEKTAMEKRNEDSFEQLKADDRSEVDAAGREIFGKTENEISSEDVYEFQGLGATSDEHSASGKGSFAGDSEISEIDSGSSDEDLAPSTSGIDSESDDVSSVGAEVVSKPPREPRKPLSPKAWAAIGVAAIILGTIMTVAAIRFYKVKYSAAYHISVAEEYIAQKDYRKAVDSYRIALTIKPDNSTAALGRVDAYLTLGTSLRETLKDREAFLAMADEDLNSLLKSSDSDVKKAVKKIQKDLKARLADLYVEITGARKLSNKEKVTLLDKALKLNPRGKQVQEIKYQLAEISIEQQQLDKAIEILEALVSDGTKLKKIPRQLAKAYFSLYKKENEPRAGMKYLERAVELDPEPRYKTSLQNIYREMAESTSDLDEKIRILSNALSLDEGNVLMRENLVELLHEKIRISAGIEEKLECFKTLEKYESDNPNNFREVVRLTYDKALNTTDAKVRLELLQYVEKNMDKPDQGLKGHIRNTYLEIGDSVENTDEKEKWYRKAYDMSPEDKSVTRRLSKVYIKRGNESDKFSSKELNYKNAQKYDPESQTVKLIYAALYYNRGVSSTDSKEKIFNFEESLKIDEGFLEVLNNLAIEYGKLGGTDNELKMLNYLKRSYAIDPTDETVKHNLALFFYNYAVREGDKAKKIQLYKKALEIDDTLEAARENHKLLTTKVFRVKDETGNIVLKSASQMKIRERPEIQDYKAYGPVDMEYLMSLELEAEKSR